eukprot:652628-Rhodomonas_salina.1
MSDDSESDGRRLAWRLDDQSSGKHAKKKGGWDEINRRPGYPNFVDTLYPGTGTRVPGYPEPPSDRLL